MPKEDSKNKIIEKENYSRKVLTGKLNNLRGILEKVVQQIKLVKDKSHVLFVELKPMLKYIDC